MYREEIIQKYMLDILRKYPEHIALICDPVMGLMSE